MKFRNDLQVLRAFAVIAVFLYHIDSKTFQYGFLGVDVFFVLSGYVIAPKLIEILYLNERRMRIEAVKKFAFRRFNRLYPAMMIMSLFTSIVIFVVGDSKQFRSQVSQLLAGILGFANISAPFEVGNYFNSSENQYLHLWSVCVEIQIYLTLPILFLVFVRIKPANIQKIYFGILTGSLTGYIFLYSDWFKIDGISGETIRNIAFYYSNFRIWEFLVGALIWIQAGKVLRTKTLLITISSLTGLTFTYLILFKIDTIAIVTLLACAITAFLLSSKITFLNHFQYSPVIWLGNRSYSIYLWHMPIIGITQALERSFHVGHLATLTVVIVSVLFISNLSYKYLEPSGRSNKRIYILTLKRLVTIFLLPLGIIMILPSILAALMPNRDYIHPEYGGWNSAKCSSDSESGEPCVILSNPNPEKSILLIGDSHANAYSKTLLEAGKETNSRIIAWTHSGCPLVLHNADKSKSKEERDICNKNFANTLTWIHEYKPELILVSVYVQNQRQLREFTTALRILKDVSEQVFIFEQNPTFPKAGPYFNYDSLSLRGKNYYESFSNSLFEDQSLLKEKVNINARKLKVQVIPVWNRFCNDRQCYRFLKGDWLYIDENHLSIFGANLIKDEIIESIRS